MGWMIEGELLARGSDPSAASWEASRDFSLGMAAVIGSLGVAVYAAIVLVAWGLAREPFSAPRLLALHAASLAVTLAAMHFLGAFGVLLGAPLAGIAAYRLLRPSRGRDRDLVA